MHARDIYITDRVPPSLSTSLVVVGRIPQEPRHFILRDELARLDAVSEHTLVAVITGLRGVGKTHLAAAHARHRLDAGRGLVGWVNAETRDTTLSGLAEIAQRLGVADRDGDSAVSAHRLRDHLSGSTDPGLLVFDDATDPDGIRDLLPAGGNTRVLITCADRSFAALGETVDLTSFRRPESVRYLAEGTGLGADGGAEQVAEDLGDLPLALSAAAATIVGRRLDYARYRQLLHDSPLPNALQRRAGHDYPRSVVQAILLSVDTTEAATDDYQLDVDVAWLLGAMAMLSPGGVRRALFRDGHRRVDEAAERCVAGSLLSWSTSGEALIMHRLVARVIRERARSTLPVSIFRRMVRDVFRRGPSPRSGIELVRSALAIILPNVVPPSEAWARRDEGVHLVDQIDALWDTGMTDLSTEKHIVAMMLARKWAVEQLISAADTTRAITLAQDVLIRSERMLGSDHLETLDARYNLARAWQAAGRLGEAIAQFQDNVAAYRRLFGDDNSFTIMMCNHLAKAYQMAGRLDDAIHLYRANIADTTRILGSDSVETAVFRGNLAMALIAAGRLDEGIDLAEDAAVNHARKFGADHPNTLLPLNNLAVAYGEAGRLGDAISLYQTILTERRKTLGADHPVTLAAQHNLGDAYELAGRYPYAIAVHEANLAARLQVLGPDHPETLKSRGGLARAYHMAQRFTEAIELHTAMVIDSERILGPDHPEYLAARDNLANAYESAGHFDRALALHETALSDFLRVLGPDHHYTLQTRNNIAGLYRRVGHGDRATELYEKLLPDVRRVLGPDHPTTLNCRNNLACAYETTGRLDEAMSIYRDNLVDCRRVLGDTHPQVLHSRSNLAHAHQSVGQIAEAIALYEENLAAFDHILGEHTAMLSTRYELADAYRSTGQLDRAIALYEKSIVQSERTLGADHPVLAHLREKLDVARRDATRQIE